MTIDSGIKLVINNPVSHWVELVAQSYNPAIPGGSRRGASLMRHIHCTIGYYLETVSEPLTPPRSLRLEIS